MIEYKGSIRLNIKSFPYLVLNIKKELGTFGTFTVIGLLCLPLDGGNSF